MGDTESLPHLIFAAIRLFNAITRHLFCHSMGSNRLLLHIMTIYRKDELEVVYLKK